jgi:hypothetical protein
MAKKLNWHLAHQRSKPSEPKDRHERLITDWLARYGADKPPEPKHQWQRQARRKAREQQRQQERRALATPLLKGV